METTQGASLFDPLPLDRPLIVAGSLYVALYDTGTLSVLTSTMDRASKRMKHESVFRGQAPADINPALPCVLWLGAQLCDDAFHAPF